MHAGVVRDMEQQRVKRERKADFEMQRALEAEYRKIQTVSDDGAGRAGSGATVDAANANVNANANAVHGT